MEGVRKAMNKTTSSIIGLIIANVLVFLYAYGVFLQISLFPPHFLTLQHFLEPVFYALVFITSNYFLFKTIYFSKKETTDKFDEVGFLTPTIFLVLILGAGFGIHTTAQMIEDLLGYRNKTLVYNLAVALDEGPGHWFFSLPLLILYFFLVKIELNRKPVSLKSFEKAVIVASSIIAGVGLGLTGFEGNFNGLTQHVFLIPLAVFLLFKIHSLRKIYKLQLWYYPFSKFLFYTFIFYFIFTLIFSLFYGFNTSPDVDLKWIIKLPF